MKSLLNKYLRMGKITAWTINIQLSHTGKTILVPVLPVMGYLSQLFKAYEINQNFSGGNFSDLLIEGLLYAWS